MNGVVTYYLLLFLVALREPENLCSTRGGNLVVSKAGTLSIFWVAVLLRWSPFRVGEGVTLSLISYLG